MVAKLATDNGAHNGRMSIKHMLQFFVLLPMCLGLFFGAARIGVYEFVSIGHHMLYLALFTVLSWICYGLGSALASIIMRPWDPNLIVVLIAGFLVGGFGLWWPLRDLVNAGFEPFLSPGSGFRTFWPPPADDLVWYFAISLQTMGLWVLANWLDFRFRRVPRFGFEAPQARQPDNAESGAVQALSADDPRLLKRLPEELQGSEIVALEAEEHYTKVHTDTGNAMLLMRFSDAIAEMEPARGMQVHRSYWVSNAHVRSINRAGKRMVLNLDNGLEVPVSRSYRVLVNSAGFASQESAQH